MCQLCILQDLKLTMIPLPLSYQLKTMLHQLLLAFPGGSEWIIIVIAVLILFGGRKIPEFMRGLGRGIREFKDAKDNVKKEIEEGMNEKKSEGSFSKEA